MDNMARCYGCMRTIEKEEKVCPHCGFDGNHYATKFYQLKLGTMLSNRYVIGKMLGEGGFGITYIAWDRNLEVPVAVKEYYPNGLVNRDTTSGNMTVFTMEGSKRESFEVGLTKVINEARRMAKFRNMNGIVSVVDFFKENGTAYIVMEYVNGITFNDYLKKNGKVVPSQVLKMFKPLIHSLDRVHKEGLIHRDISPDNIMINEEGEIRLLDFGAARDYGEDEKSLSIMLKRGYAPEEQYRSKGKQGPWTDVYALCATMYKMMTGITPEESLDRMAEDDLVAPNKLGIEIEGSMEEVLLKGLAVFQNQRIQSMDELYDGLYGEKEDETVSSSVVSEIIVNEDEQPDDQTQLMVEEEEAEGTQLLVEEEDEPEGTLLLEEEESDRAQLEEEDESEGTLLLEEEEESAGTQLLEEVEETESTQFLEESIIGKSIIEETDQTQFLENTESTQNDSIQMFVDEKLEQTGKTKVSLEEPKKEEIANNNDNKESYNVSVQNMEVKKSVNWKRAAAVGIGLLVFVLGSMILPRVIRGLKDDTSETVTSNTTNDVIVEVSGIAISEKNEYTYYFKGEIVHESDAADWNGEYDAVVFIDTMGRVIKTYYDQSGVITLKEEYDELGYCVKRTQLGEDDKYEIMEYENDANGNAIKCTTSDESGNIMEVCVYENDAEGRLIKTTVTDSLGKIQKILEFGHDAEGQQEIRKATLYDEVGNIAQTNEYENGLDIKSEHYKEGVLFRVFYKEYNSNKQHIKTTRCDKEGNVQCVFLYEYDSNGNEIKRTTTNSEGSVESYNIKEYDSNGNNTKTCYYDANGELRSYTVYEYDANGNEIKSTNFNPDGSVYNN